jgi:transposase-like protein
MKRKQYSLDFKRKALARVANGESQEAVAQDLKLSTTSLLYKWKQRIGKEKAVMTADSREKDAIVYLKHARVAMTEELRKGSVRELSKSNLLSLLALETLLNGER